jgi:hypothetical protein
MLNFVSTCPKGAKTHLRASTQFFGVIPRTSVLKEREGKGIKRVRVEGRKGSKGRWRGVEGKRRDGSGREEGKGRMVKHPASHKCF